MNQRKKSVLVVGFNTRPLVYSLHCAGYDVYAVDFFGDIDLYPYIKDSFIITKEVDALYDVIKYSYSKFLTKFTIEMLNKYPEVDYLILGSGLDNAFEERELILNEIKKRKIKTVSLNNETHIVKKARDIEKIYEILNENNYRVPFTQSFVSYKSNLDKLQFPFIIKKRASSGGINIYKVNDINRFSFLLEKLKTKVFNPSEWLIQEYIEGIPVSCTTISNGTNSQVVSINRQLIGEKYLNAPEEFIYCGNIVPGNLLKKDNDLISEISLAIAEKLQLQGLNGFDFVLREHYPYLMEINPRIPGSIQASESALDLNLLDMHIKSFDDKKWGTINQILLRTKAKNFSSKLILFAPREISLVKLKEINELEYVHDKTKPDKNILKGEPVCSILYKAETFSNSYFGALKVLDNIYRIIG
ncbi:MAG: ATP-grasp domain-containing protein [Candidatus Hodarchaeota archaeon]